MASRSIILLLFAAVLFTSCERPSEPPSSTAVPEPAAVPQAFQEDGPLESVVEIKSRGYGSNAVDKLFAEALESDTALANLLERWDDHAPLYSEHLEPCRVFSGNNEDYYTDAGSKASAMIDTTMKAGISDRIKASEQRYEGIIAPFRRNIDQHAAIVQHGGDLITLIKLERTLDMVENYQRGNLPDRKLLEKDIATLSALRDELRARVKP